MARLSEKTFETKKFAGGLVVALFVVAGPQTVVDSLSLD